MQPPLFFTAVNRILRRNSWALERLRAHAGKSVRLDCIPLVLAFTVLEHGEVAPGPPAEPNATIRITPGVMLRMLARDDTAWHDVAVSGDTELAAAIHHVWRNIRWEAEEDLARVFGDVAAHRMAQTVAALDQWRAQSFDNFARTLSEYWTEEQPLIARAHDVGAFNREVDRLRDDVARVEKRVERLIAAREGRPAS